MTSLDHVPVLFDKTRAEQLLKAIEKGEPIAPPDPAGWTVHDRLVVAGVLAFTVGTCPSPAGKSYSVADLMAAVALCSQLAPCIHRPAPSTGNKRVRASGHSHRAGRGS